MNKTGYLIPMVLLMLSACQTPTPSAPVARATATLRPIVQVATITAVPPSPTASPTSAPTSAPTGAPTKSPTATALAVTATVTPTATVTSTPATSTPIAATTAPTPAAPPSTEPAVTSIAPAGYVYVISMDGLNLRADHTVSSNILAALANGQRLQTNGLGFGPDDQGIQWLNVKTDDGALGWVAADYVSTQVPSVSPAQPPVNDSAIAAELLRRTNDLRQQNGLPPYIMNNDLLALALAHSQYMAQNGITHSGDGGVSAKARIQNAGYGAGNPTENIYGGQATIEDAWDYWKSDPPHLRNLLDPVNTVIGIGVYQAGLATYYTQDFGKPAQ